MAGTVTGVHWWRAAKHEKQLVPRSSSRLVLQRPAFHPTETISRTDPWHAADAAPLTKDCANQAAAAGGGFRTALSHPHSDHRTSRRSSTP